MSFLFLFTIILGFGIPEEEFTVKHPKQELVTSKLPKPLVPPIISGTKQNRLYSRKMLLK